MPNRVWQADKPLVPDPGVSSESGKPGEAFYFDYGHPTDFGHGVSGLDGAGSERALGMERVGFGEHCCLSREAGKGLGGLLNERSSLFVWGVVTTTASYVF